MKMLYRTLLENEVDERYANQIMEEGEKVLHNGSSVDMILANVYQKLILKLGQPEVICADGKKPRVIFFIGPTGVGKTTTLAKIASKYKVEYEKKVAFLTADTYRIAATDQLRTYANILDVPMSVIYTETEMNRAIERMSDYDLVFVDTAGFSHRNDTQRSDMKELLDGLDEILRKGSLSRLKRDDKVSGSVGDCRYLQGTGRLPAHFHQAGRDIRLWQYFKYETLFRREAFLYGGGAECSGGH